MRFTFKQKNGSTQSSFINAARARSSEARVVTTMTANFFSFVIRDGTD
jgi:hypothetical protein